MEQLMGRWKREGGGGVAVSVYRVGGGGEGFRCVSTEPCQESQRAVLPGNPWQQLLLLLLLSHFLQLSGGGGSLFPTGQR